MLEFILTGEHERSPLAILKRCKGYYDKIEKWAFISLVKCGDIFIRFKQQIFRRKNFELYESINILPVFNLTYVRNYGAAFSFLADHDGWQNTFYCACHRDFTDVVLFSRKNQATQKLQNIAYALIIGGALGNMIDRLYHGFVVDFFDFYWDIYHYPVFNVADIAISLGAGLMILDAFKNRHEPEQRTE